MKSKPRFFVVIALVSFVNLTHVASFEKGVSVEGTVLVRLVGGHLLGIVLGVQEEPAHCGQYHFLDGDPGLYKKAGQARVSGQTSN